MKPPILLLIALVVRTACLAQAPAPLTLADCYSLAEKNYPLVKQRELIAKTTEFTIANIQKGYWPQLNVNGQASYQSAVTEIPIKIPNVSIPSPSKDQYKIYGEISQVLYDGGAIKQQKQVQTTAEAVQQKQLESELYQLRERINQLFFGTLLIDEQLKQNDLLDKDIQTGLSKMQAAVANGTALRSSVDVLKADQLKNRQRAIELHAARRTYAAMLGIFTGRNITESTTLARPKPANSSLQINRPELSVYEAQDNNYDAQQQLTATKSLPKFGLFLQGGAGRPALNLLSNKFEGYYIGGFRLTWNPSALYTIKKEKEIIQNGRRNLNIQKETFLFNTNLAATQQRTELSKYQELLDSDDQIIELRTHIKVTSIAQLENGVINSNDYLREVNAEDEARQSKIVHEIQMLTAAYSLQTTTGNEQ